MSSAMRVFFIPGLIALLAWGCACRPESRGTDRARPAGEPPDEFKDGRTAVAESKSPERGLDAATNSALEPASYQTVASADGTYVVRFAPVAAAIPLNRPFSLTVDIVPNSGIPAEGISLSVDAAMPQHAHGMNTVPRVQSLGGRRYDVAGMLFHMPGYWEVYFDVTRDGVTERAQLGFTLEQ